MSKKYNLMELVLMSISSIIFLISFFLFLKKKTGVIEVVFYFVWTLLFMSLIVSREYKDVFVESVINGFSLLFFVWLILLPPLLYSIISINLKDKKINIKNFYLSFVLFFINVFSLVYFSIQKDEKVFTYEVVENVMTYTNFVVILFVFPISTIYYSFKSFQIVRSLSSKKVLENKTEKFYFFCFVLFFDLYILIWFIQNYLIKDATIKEVLKTYYVIYFIVSLFVLWKAKMCILNRENRKADSLQNLFSEIDDKLILKMEVEKIFVQSDLNVKSLAKEIDTNEKYLSQVINKKYKVNFSNYINDYRIEYSKKLLLDDDFSNYTIEAIGSLSGFSSKSGFNATFKKNTGVTPTDYKKGAD